MKKPLKPTQKAENVTPKGWLSDVSLESFGPARAHQPGERELKFAVRGISAHMPQQKMLRLDLILAAHIVTADNPVALAEICYSSIVEKTQKDVSQQQIIDLLYPEARQSLADALALLGHYPPFPTSIAEGK
jgi:hypothetical protein